MNWIDCEACPPAKLRKTQRCRNCVSFADVDVNRARHEAAVLSKGTERPVPSVYADITSMLAGEKLDVVSVCTPNTSHVHIAVEALNAGVHVLLEKPMATCLEDAEQLVSTVEDSGKICMVGMSHRYRQDVELLKRYIDAGDIGEIYYAKTRILRRRGAPSGWFTDRSLSGGGPLMDIGVHALDLTWWLTGCPTARAVSGHLYQGIGNDHVDFIQNWQSSSPGNQDNEVYTTEDFASAYIRFHNGCVLQMEVSWALNGPQDDAVKVEIFGSKGGVSLDPLQYYTARHGALTTNSLSASVGLLYQQEIDHFVSCARSGTSPCSDVYQGRDVVEMLAAIERSSTEQREVIV